MRGIGRVSAFLVILGLTACAGAVTASWTGLGGDSSWSTAANWSTGIVPNLSSTDVVIGDAAPSTISLNSASNVLLKSLTITKSSDLTIAKGTGAGAIIEIYSNAPVVYNPGNASTFIVDSTITYLWNGATNGPPASKDPVYEVDGQATYRSQTLNWAVKTGTLSFTKTGTGTYWAKDNAATSQNTFPSTVTISAGKLAIGRGQSGDTAVLGPLTKGTTVTVNIASGATFEFDGLPGYNDSNKSTGTGTANGILGNFAGSGTINMAGIAVNANTMIAPGCMFSPGVTTASGSGVLSLQGNLTFALVPTTTSTTAAGTAGKACSLNIDIPAGSIGMTPGVDFDQLAVTGTVSTIGNCDLIVNGTGAVAGNSYAFLTSANDLSAASFKSVAVSNTALPYAVAPIASGLGYQITFTPEPATLSVLVLGGLAMLKRKS